MVNIREKNLKNITISLPEIYDKNIKKLIDMNIHNSRSEFVRIAIREYLYQDFENLVILGYYKKLKEKYDYDGKK